jgi:hypothetical protein
MAAQLGTLLQATILKYTVVVIPNQSFLAKRCNLNEF